MGNIEKIRHEIEFLKELNEGLYTEGDNSYYEGHDNACNHILTFIDSLPEENLSYVTDSPGDPGHPGEPGISDLEEAAEKYADEETMYKPIIDKRISQRADEFAQREYICDSSERDALSKGYYWGYKDAQKDLALTWEDMKQIVMISVELSRKRFDDFYVHQTISDEEQFSEVLKRFNEQRKK